MKYRQTDSKSVITSKCHTSILGVTLCAIILYEYYQSLIQRELSENLQKEQESLKRMCLFICSGGEGNTITTTTENMGLYIRNVTTIDDDTADIYAAITGDQVALTNIRIM